MRVVCIYDNCVYEKGCTPLKKGCIYSVLEETYINGLSSRGVKCAVGVYYHLVETGAWHHESLFVPINEDQQDETELIRERQKQLV